MMQSINCLSYLPLFCMFKSDVRRNDVYVVGLSDFFSGKRFRICLRLFWIFRGLTCDFFFSSVHFHC